MIKCYFGEAIVDYVVDAHARFVVVHGSGQAASVLWPWLEVKPLSAKFVQKHEC